MEDAGRGYRIVVASPMPMKIRELKTIETLVDAGHIVITCGGGGIPVVNDNGRLSGVNAVIDKDNASSLLAAELEADYLIILTAVEKVAINFGSRRRPPCLFLSPPRLKSAYSPLSVCFRTVRIRNCLLKF